jgi:hypothetical protein
MTNATPSKPSFVQRARKFLIGAVGLGAVLLSSGQLDGRTEAIVSGLVAVATALGIYQVPNARGGYVGEHRAEV